MFITLILLLSIPAMATGKVIFEMEDPVGDAFGDGQFIYPLLDELGEKASEMFDLTNFRVLDLGRDIELRLSFKIEPNQINPFGGEGFNFHRIDIYLVTGEGGSKETFRRGPNVNFYIPWNKVIRVIDWNQTRVFAYTDSPADPNAGTGVGEGLQVGVEGKDIVITVSKDIIGELDRRTRYYVLVGILDGLGKDQYLNVGQNATRYEGGGGHDSDINPNLFDILVKTSESQFKQLGAWRNGDPVILYPVGATSGGRNFRFALFVIIIFTITGLAVSYIRRK